MVGINPEVIIVINTFYTAIPFLPTNSIILQPPLQVRLQIQPFSNQRILQPFVLLGS